MKQHTLRPQDVAVALQVALTPSLPYASLAARLGLSVGEVHNAVQRLRGARLVGLRELRVVKPVLFEFLVSGVPYAFPAMLGRQAKGVPTAHAAPPLSAEIDAEEAVVWPSVHGTERGSTLTPLYPGAPDLVEKNPALYELLTLVDALRIGQARERRLAKEFLRRALLEKVPT
jgi:hypothetical protein